MHVRETVHVRPHGGPMLQLNYLLVSAVVTRSSPHWSAPEKQYRQQVTQQNSTTRTEIICHCFSAEGTEAKNSIAEFIQKGSAKLGSSGTFVIWHQSPKSCCLIQYIACTINRWHDLLLINFNFQLFIYYQFDEENVFAQQFTFSEPRWIYIVCYMRRTTGFRKATAFSA